MNKLSTILLLVLSLLLMNCNKDKEVSVKPDVETFIQLLKSNQYDANELPAFTSHDIEALLKYRNDTSIVTIFPSSGISSYKPLEPKYQLNILVLWTIESIRNPIMNIPGRFPSQNPFIALKDDPTKWIENHDNQAYDVISQAYFDWWQTNKTNEFDQFKNIDPLENTEYVWH